MDAETGTCLDGVTGGADGRDGAPAKVGRELGRLCFVLCVLYWGCGGVVRRLAPAAPVRTPFILIHTIQSNIWPAHKHTNAHLERGRHEDELQVGAACCDEIAQDYAKELGVLVPFMHLFDRC